VVREKGAGGEGGGQGARVERRRSKVGKQRSQAGWRSFAYGEGQFEFSQDLSARKRHEIPLGEHPMVLGSVRTQLDAALSPAIARSPGLNSSCDKAQEAQESVACKAAARRRAARIVDQPFRLALDARPVRSSRGRPPQRCRDLRPACPIPLRCSAKPNLRCARRTQAGAKRGRGRAESDAGHPVRECLTVRPGLAWAHRKARGPQLPSGSPPPGDGGALPASGGAPRRRARGY